jgi:hypothetical protein
MAQVVQCLPSKNEALSSILSDGGCLLPCPLSSTHASLVPLTFDGGERWKAVTSCEASRIPLQPWVRDHYPISHFSSNLSS